MLPKVWTIYLTHMVLDCVRQLFCPLLYTDSTNPSQHNCLLYFRHATGKVACIPLHLPVSLLIILFFSVGCSGTAHTRITSRSRTEQLCHPPRGQRSVSREILFKIKKVCHPWDCWILDDGSEPFFLFFRPYHSIWITNFCIYSTMS